jgi:hypothetical protein
MSVCYLHHIHHADPFPATSPLPPVPPLYSYSRTYSSLLLSDSVEEKNFKKEKHDVFASFR